LIQAQYHWGELEAR